MKKQSIRNASRFAIIGLLVLWIPLLVSCSKNGKSEPEQVFLVSAVGFDADGDQMHLSLEIPVVSAGGDGMEKPMVLSASGKSVEAALGRITAKLGRDLLFSHCALMVLGEDLTREQLEAAFDFVGSGMYLPLACEVVAAENAERLLGSSCLSSPAVGYEIPAIYKHERELIGMDLKSEVYAICSSEIPEEQILLPLFEPSVEETDAPTFQGLRILRVGSEAVTIDRAECMAYAILSDHFQGGNGKAGQVLDVTMDRVSTELSASLSEESLHLSISLSARIGESKTDEELQHLENRIAAEIKALFARLQVLTGEDLFYFSERLQKQDAAIQSALKQNGLAHAELTVVCRLVKRGEGRP